MGVLGVKKFIDDGVTCPNTWQDMWKHTWAKVDFLAPKQNQTKVKDLNFEQNEPNNFLAIKMEMNNNKKQPKNLLTKRYKSKIKQN